MVDARRYSRQGGVASVRRRGAAFLVLLLVAANARMAQSAPLFASPFRSFDTGGLLLSAAAGDLNGDGLADVVTGFGDSIAVLLGESDAAFGPPSYFITGAQPAFLALGDLNGDGALDVVAPSRGEYPDYARDVSVLLGNGDGTFRPKQSYETRLEPADVGIADLNGDGKLDVVIASHEYSVSTVSVFLGNGDGTLAARQDFATRRAPEGVCIGDLNADGPPAWISTDRNRLTVVRGG